MNNKNSFMLRAIELSIESVDNNGGHNTINSLIYLGNSIWNSGIIIPIILGRVWVAEIVDQ